MSQSGVEVFPAMSAACQPTQSALTRRDGPRTQAGSGARPRRKSSGLGSDPPGDTAGPALSTLSDRSPPSTPAPSRTPSEQKQPGRKRRKAKTLFRRWKAVSLRHTWLNPLVICLVVLSLYLASPSPSNPVHAALFLSYPLPRDPAADPSAPVEYGKGGRDLAFVAFYTVFLSFTREFLMQRAIRPLAVRAGIRSRAKQSRFMEQFYTALYFAVFGPFGLFVMSRTPVWYFRTEAMYDGFPHRSHDALFKAYYLLQASYWAQQMIVLLLMLEKPRKDFKELVMHHVITLALIWLSYRFHFTYMGLAVYITHDISDFFLATSKLLNYLDSPFVGPYFFLFILVWTYLRHYMNLRILSSILPLTGLFDGRGAGGPAWTHGLMGYVGLSRSSLLPSFLYDASVPFSNATAPSAGMYALGNVTADAMERPWFPRWQSQFAAVGPYALDWGTQQYKCWISQAITFALLACLQAVNLFWLFLILRIAWRFVWTKTATDVRSDDEEEDEEAEGRGRADDGGKARIGQPTVLINGEPVEVVEEKKVR